MEKHTIGERVEALRAWMRDKGLAAYIIPTMDPHDSEYLPAHWQTRQWITGFTGSAGTAIVSLDEAALWTDSRYWLQAEQQLADTPFVLRRDGVDESIRDWLGAHVEGRVGYLPVVMPDVLLREYTDGLHVQGFDEDPFNSLWKDRPALPLSLIERMSDALAGETAASKLERIRQWIENRGKVDILLRELSEIAWTLNLRADDIPCNPFFISFLRLRAKGGGVLYVHEEQVSPDVRDYLASLHIDIEPYEKAPALRFSHSPVAEMRAAKNPTEQEGFRQAHLRDGVAMVRLLRRLDEADLSTWTELRVDRELTALRAEQPGFRGLSFETIAGYGANGAIVHYEPTPETDTPLQPRGLLLLDSGGHYDCGTTDITRTIPLGPLNDEEKRAFTLVLKGHLQLLHAVFPAGTTGIQLDALARLALWREGFDYGHGTGHGVGHRLGVHEGPVQFRKNCRPDTTHPLVLGQTITVEPGLYMKDKFGVRHENTALVVPAFQSGFGDFWRLESLTRCPYDLRAIVAELLTAEERQWLNAYHAQVCRDLLPLLSDPADQAWLAKATRAI